MPNKKIFVISLGGSIIVPEPGKINFQFLKEFRKLVLKFIKKRWKFIIVVGGGKTCRLYQKAALKITKIPFEELDWLGIYATKLNAYLLKIIFKKETLPIILDNPYKKTKKESLKKPVIIASGWKPGWSTDYVTVLLAKRFGVKTIVNASNISFLHEKDIKIHKEAKKISEISWKGYQNIIGKKWNPGRSFPFDPVATKKAKKLNLKVIIVKGTNLKNLERVLMGKKFKGTIIKNN
ncbi:MAG: UMP kinase [bacterium]|nr:UMP kinase [bacterium]